MLSTPDPVAFTIFGFEIRWYALLICTGIIIAMFIIEKRCKKVGINEDTCYDLILAAVPLGVIGARLYYVFFEWDFYKLHPEKIIAIWEGGLAIHGAILFGFLGLCLVCKIKKLKILQVCDIIVPALSLAQSIGRWGNYFNQEAHGCETTVPWAIKVYEAGKGYIMVHPTFLYESICDFLIFLIILLIIDKKKKHDGVNFASYLIMYSVCRFFIEGLRTDSLYIFGLRTAQLVSVICIMIGVAMLIILGSKKEPETDE